jgi:hypothetical protein
MGALERAQCWSFQEQELHVLNHVCLNQVGCKILDSFGRC